MARNARYSSGATFVISVAAELAGMHPQTLRQYDRLGLVTPERTKGRGRRYTHKHVDLLREVQRLSQDEGINLAGIQRILDLQNQVESLEAERERLLARVKELEGRQNRVFAADTSGQVRQFRRGQRIPRENLTDPRSGQVVVWRPWNGMASARVQPRAIEASSSPAQRHTIIETDGTNIRIIDGTIS